MAGLVLFAASAAAANTSAYTKYDLKTCRVIEKGNPEEEYAGAWGCKGYKGRPEYEVVFSEGDLRSLLSFGRNAGNHCAAQQSLPGFNSTGDTVEWRLRNGRPFATIVRWKASYDPEDSSKTHDWLVITRLEADNSCHMAYVDGTLAGANEKARDIADRLAPEFSCKTGELSVHTPDAAKKDEVPSGPSCPQQ